MFDTKEIFSLLKKLNIIPSSHLWKEIQIESDVFNNVEKILVLFSTHNYLCVEKPESDRDRCKLMTLWHIKDPTPQITSKIKDCTGSVSKESEIK